MATATVTIGPMLADFTGRLESIDHKQNVAMVRLDLEQSMQIAAMRLENAEATVKMNLLIEELVIFVSQQQWHEAYMKLLDLYCYRLTKGI